MFLGRSIRVEPGQPGGGAPHVVIIALFWGLMIGRRKETCGDPSNN